MPTDQVNSRPITQYPNAPDIESSSEDYARRFSSPVGQWLLSHQETATREAIEQCFIGDQELSVLDVGGGHGQNIDLVTNMGHKITVFGSNESCSTTISDQIQSGVVAFDSGSLIKMPYPDNNFDVVICYRILSHMASWQDLVIELTRVSRNLVLVDYPSHRSLNIISDVLFNVKKGIEKNTRPFKCYYDRDIDQAFLELGFVRRYRYRQFFLPMALHRLIGRVAISRVTCGISRTLGLNKFFGSPVIAAYSRAEPG